MYSQQGKRVIRWGILGTARIANDRVIPAIKEASNAEVMAIAGRNAKKIKAYSDSHDIARQYISFDDLLNDENIDAVYIPLPNHMHAEWTIKAAEEGKHVLCEKPVGLDAAEVKAMGAVCRKKGVLLMEAFAFRYNSQWQRLLNIINSGEIGSIISAQINYSVKVEHPEDIRFNPDMGGGVLYDIGSYCVNAFTSIMNSAPIDVKVLALCSTDGRVDRTISVILKFSRERLAQFTCTFEGAYHQDMLLTGTKGIIKIKRPFHAPHMTLVKNDQETLIGYERKSTLYKNQIEHFGNCVLNGHSPLYGLEESIANMEVIITMLDSLDKF